MSSDPVIRVVGMSKAFHVGTTRKREDLLSVRLANGVRRMMSRRKASSESMHWALRDLSFEIAEGDVVALIGHNGAGKSTLLKILARITDPTSGFAELRGRVGSLLEVGTGFHPELTGRENVYLSGAVLGISRAEITRDFDEIVAFAEVEKYIDTPVKHYSSGMQVRLGFAVATQLKPEILLIDEVLAVGDAQFQRKCLQRIQDVSRGNRTIIFVSHNMAAIRAICRTAYVLEGGQIVAKGETGPVVDEYLSRVQASQTANVAVSTASFHVDRVEIKAANGVVIKTFDSMTIAVTFTAMKDLLEPGLLVKIMTNSHERVASLDYYDLGAIGPVAAGEQRTVGFRIDRVPLLPGMYVVELDLKASYRVVERVDQLYTFDVVETPLFGTRRPRSGNGSVALDASLLEEPST